MTGILCGLFENKLLVSLMNSEAETRNKKRGLRISLCCFYFLTFPAICLESIFSFSAQRRCATTVSAKNKKLLSQAFHSFLNGF